MTVSRGKLLIRYSFVPELGLSKEISVCETQFTQLQFIAKILILEWLKALPSLELDHAPHKSGV